MDLQSFLMLEEKQKLQYKTQKIYRGIPVSFKYITSQDGKKLMTATTEDGTVFVLETSVYNPDRFKEWDKKRARADIQILGKEKSPRRIRYIDVGRFKYPLIRIDTTVSYNKEEPKKEKEINKDTVY